MASLAARAAVARALALALAPPQGPTPEFLRHGLAPKIAQAAPYLPDGGRLLERAGAAAAALAGAQDLAAEHQRLFRTGLVVTPYESEYGADRAARKGAVLADILGFYRAFGFRPAPGAAELPDHMGAELEFLALLLLKAADGRGRGVAAEAEVAHDAARAFFADHLGRWAPAFARGLREAARHPFYGAVADLLETFLEGEAARLGARLGDFRALPSGSPAGCPACPVGLAAPPERGDR